METSEIKSLVQQALTSLCKSQMYYKVGFPKAQRIGLQGEKRRFRKETAKHHNLINYLISDAFDTFSIIVDTTSPTISQIDIVDVPSFFKNYLAVLEKEYVELHSIANALVVSFARNYAELLYEKCSCLIEYIKYYRRTIVQGDIMGWSPEYISYNLLHQTTEENVHDEEETKEKKIGYTF